MAYIVAVRPVFLAYGQPALGHNTSQGDAVGRAQQPPSFTGASKTPQS
jgi:hypothetical protein